MPQAKSTLHAILAVIFLLMHVPAALACTQICVVCTVFAILVPIMLIPCLVVSSVLAVCFAYVAKNCYELWAGEPLPQWQDVVIAALLIGLGVAGAVFVWHHPRKPMDPWFFASVSSSVGTFGLAIASYLLRSKPTRSRVVLRDKATSNKT